MIFYSFVIIFNRIAAILKYYIKFIFFGVASTIFACVPIPIMLVRPRDSRNALLPARGIRFGCLLIGVSTSIEGHENIIENSGCVVLMNHQSVLDLLVLAELWPIMSNCCVISKKEIFYFQPFATAAWLWGTIFIDRSHKGRAQEAINRTSETIQKKKARVLIFPEGTRNFEDQMVPFKKGAFHLAISSKCPIQPVVVNRYRFIGQHKFDNGHIRIKILPAIDTTGYNKSNIQELVDKTFNLMAENIELITKDEHDFTKKCQ